MHTAAAGIGACEAESLHTSTVGLQAPSPAAVNMRDGSVKAQVFAKGPNQQAAEGYHLAQGVHICKVVQGVHVSTTRTVLKVTPTEND